MPLRRYKDADGGPIRDAKRLWRAAANRRTLRTNTHTSIPAASEESCPAGSLSGGGLAVVSAVPAGPWLTLMFRNGRRYFTNLDFF